MIWASVIEGIEQDWITRYSSERWQEADYTEPPFTKVPRNGCSLKTGWQQQGCAEKRLAFQKETRLQYKKQGRTARKKQAASQEKKQVAQEKKQVALLFVFVGMRRTWVVGQIARYLEICNTRSCPALKHGAVDHLMVGLRVGGGPYG